MLISGMAAGRRAKQISAAASVSRQVSAAARRPCSQPGYQVRHHVFKDHGFRWSSTCAFPPPGAIRAPVSQISHLSLEDMDADIYRSGRQFMEEAEIFERLNENPLLKGKVPDHLVKLKALRTFMTSSLGIAYQNHVRGVSVGISFFEDNIDVSSTFEETRLKEAWGYRLDSSQGVTRDSTYYALAVTVDKMVRRIHPDVQYPLCFNGLMRRMKGLDMFSNDAAPPLDEETELHMLHNASLFSVDDHIRFMTDMEILLKWKLPLYRGQKTVRNLLKAIYKAVATLDGYDGALWLQTIDKHKFSQVCYEFSQEAREARETPMSDGEKKMRDAIIKGLVARKCTGALAVAVKGVGIGDEHRFPELCIRQVSLHRAIVFHLYQEILRDPEIQACFPYSVEDMGAAIRAILPLTAVVIQNVLFENGWFHRIGMTKYRSVSPYTLRNSTVCSSPPHLPSPGQNTGAAFWAEPDEALF